MGRLREAFDLFQDMKIRGITPDVKTYTVMINIYVKMGRLPEAYDLFQDMNIRGIKPDVIAYEVLLNSLLNERKNKIALDLYNEMSLKGMRPGATLNRRIKEATRGLGYYVMPKFHIKYYGISGGVFKWLDSFPLVERVTYEGADWKGRVKHRRVQRLGCQLSRKFQKQIALKKGQKCTFRSVLSEARLQKRIFQKLLKKWLEGRHQRQILSSERWNLSKELLK
ncbi:pentatricopeptide repeat-containing protein [Trifolium pratense]|uniref:Pentatricopeptide repeat-containing protein n=1 Tax=Trifolium pratense TaxID=57577 RepID=A0A2K3LK13_TRIPR|nr:pentatricopeptide repeat-containing protein [Trifolium pratense]